MPPTLASSTPTLDRRLCMPTLYQPARREASIRFAVLGQAQRLDLRPAKSMLWKNLL